MISKPAAQAQMDRMGQLSYPPKTKAEAGEILAALMLADSEGIAEFFVSEWIDSQREWPKPFDVRSKIRELNGERKQKQVKCEICGGGGFRTVWFLVTYHGKSFKIARSERLDFTGEPQAQSFRETLARADGLGSDMQDVVSAAEPCACRSIRSVA